MISQNDVESYKKSLGDLKLKLEQITNTAELTNILHYLDISVEILNARFLSELIILLDKPIFDDLMKHLNAVSTATKNLLAHTPNSQTIFIRDSNSFVTATFKYQSQIPFLKAEDIPDVLSAYDMFVEQVKRENIAYDQKINELTDKLDTLTTKSTTIEQQVITTLDTIKDTQETQNIKFSQAEESRSSKFDTVLQQKDREFSNLMTTIKNENEKMTTNAKQIFEKQNSDTEEKHKQYITQLETELQTTKNVCDAKLKEIEKVLSIAANTALSGISEKHAKDCKKSASSLFWTAFGLMIIGAIVLVISFWSVFSTGTITIGATLFRFTFAIPLFLPAFYCACEARRMNDKEQFYRDFSIKVATIPPYLNGVDGSDVNEKGELARTEEEKLALLHHLITENKFKSAKDSVVIPRDVLQLLDRFIKLIPQAGK